MATAPTPPSATAASAAAVQSSRLSRRFGGCAATLHTLAYGLTVRHRMEGADDAAHEQRSRAGVRGDARGYRRDPGARGRAERPGVAEGVATDAVRGRPGSRGRTGRARAHPLLGLPL